MLPNSINKFQYNNKFVFHQVFFPQYALDFHVWVLLDVPYLNNFVTGKCPTLLEHLNATEKESDVSPGRETTRTFLTSFCIPLMQLSLQNLQHTLLHLGLYWG